MYGYCLFGIFGYFLIIGGYFGDQVEFCCVFNVDFMCVKVLKDIDVSKLVGFVDVIFIVWYGNELVEVGKGDVVGVWGCGVVGFLI